MEMIPGIYSFFGYRLPLEERLRLISKAGFQASSFWWDDDEPLFRQGKKQDIVSMFRDNGLSLDSIHVPYSEQNQLWSDNLVIRRRMIDRHKSWIDDCVEFSIPNLVMHVCQGVPKHIPNKWGLTTIAKIIEYAEGAGVYLAIENTRLPRLIDHLFEHFDSPNLGFCYDSSHDFLYSEKPTSLLKRWGRRLYVTHISDNDGKMDRHWPPGTGKLDWKLIRQSFPNGYRGILQLETIPDGEHSNITAENYLKKNMRWLKRWWKA